jgi:hypothetical protein
MTITQLLQSADTIIANELKSELRAQGHYNTGNLEKTLKGLVTKQGDTSSLIGTAPYYALVLHHGFGPEKASFKQVPFLINYFLSKGYNPKEAKSFAFATVKKWMVEGSPTKGSYAYSTTGARLKVIEIVNKAISPKVNSTMSDGLDAIINSKFHETKSETI